MKPTAPEAAIGSRRRFGQRVKGGQTGAALIEVAMTIPILLLICVGVFEFGRAFQTWQVLTNAAREGARVSVTPEATAGAVEGVVRSYMQTGQLPEYGSASVNVNRSSTIMVNGAPRPASSVTVTYPYTFMVLNPVVRLVVPSSNTGAGVLNMTATAVMRNEEG